MLTHALKRELLGIARSSIAAALEQEPARSDVAPSRALLQQGGAFVTLRVDHELRGCIGYMESSLPLAEVVTEVAAKAAFEDPRFSPLTLSELEQTTVEISILSPSRRVYSKDEIRVGEHGLILELGFSKGVLLPQVATEYGWTAEQFLEGLCRKSGLHKLAWRDPDARVSVFTAEVFNEEEILPRASRVNMKNAERQCVVCGQFYPADPDELRKNIRELIAAVELSEIDGTVRGIIVPHAGYEYSGFTAAHAFAVLQGKKYPTVIIVSPSHREYFDGVSVFAGESYGTPLGIVRVDVNLRERLLKCSSVTSASYAGHGAEHAIEVHLPFLQVVLGEFKLLPIVVGDQKREYCYALGEALSEILKNENALLVASTDLSHYYSSAVANRLDAIAIEDVKKFDYEALMQDLEAENTQACGGGPTVAVMLALKELGARRMSILHHCNSGDVTGDHSQVVGYLAAAAYA